MIRMRCWLCVSCSYVCVHIRMYVSNVMCTLPPNMPDSMKDCRVPLCICVRDAGMLMLLFVSVICVCMYVYIYVYVYVYDVFMCMCVCVFFSL